MPALRRAETGAIGVQGLEKDFKFEVKNSTPLCHGKVEKLHGRVFCFEKKIAMMPIVRRQTTGLLNIQNIHVSA